jgi:mono/diheme cytochrome c family protein
MWRALLLGLLLTASAGALSCGDREKSSAPLASSVAQGREWFESYCADCHGVGGKGDGPRAAGLAQPPGDLTEIAGGNGGLYIPGAVAEYVDGRRVITAHGTRDMPVWGRRLDDRNDNLTEETRLTQDMIGAIVAYLRTLQRRAS